MKLSELKKLASENGISLKHLNGKMLKKSELAEKLMHKGVMVKSPKKSRKPSRKKSRKTSRKPKKTRRKPKKASRKPKKTSRKPKKASRKPKKTSRKPKKTSRKPKKTSKTRSGKPKLNAYMVFVGKHRRKSAKKKASRKRKSAKKKASRKRKSTKNKFRMLDLPPEGELSWKWFLLNREYEAAMAAQHYVEADAIYEEIMELNRRMHAAAQAREQ